MKISVIISAHKPSRYLDESIKSALDQDFDDYEIILSSDGCSELEWYAKNYKINFVLTPKGNHSTAYNNATLQASGEYVKDHHWDDILMPDALKNLWTGYGADLIYGNGLNFYENGREKLFRSDPVITWGSFWPPIRTGIHGAAFIVKKETKLRLGGQDETLVNSEEVDFYMKIFKAGGTFKYVDKTIVKYRIHGDQKTHFYDKDKRADVAAILYSRYAK
jgi:glycosyltransferase involved in cell wall biosynthesis